MANPPSAKKHPLRGTLLASAPASRALQGMVPSSLANRRLLFQTLSQTGLTNYAGEWWHWSYGDSGWALRVRAAKALYERLPEE